MTDEKAEYLEGGCACGNLRYRLTAKPLIVQCCHCKRCQRESGSAFVINALIEKKHFQLLKVRPQPTSIPTDSRKGQKVCRCPICKTAIWSHYHEFGDAVCFVRVGTLDEPNELPPQVHLFTESMQSWMQLPEEIPKAAQNYNRQEIWSQESQQRLESLGYTFPQKWLQQILTPGPIHKRPGDKS